MKENIDKKLLINKRKSKAWTQSHLAEVSSLSLRTVQRIEKTGKASYESIKSLASAYEIVVQDLILTNNTEKNKRDVRNNTKGNTMSKIGLALSFSLLLAILYTLMKLAFLYFEISSIGTNNPKMLAGGISKALIAPMISSIISYVGLIIFGLSRVLYGYNNISYNKLILFPIIILIVINPIPVLMLILLYLLIIKNTEKLKTIQ